MSKHQLPGGAEGSSPVPLSTNSPVPPLPHLWFKRETPSRGFPATDNYLSPPPRSQSIFNHLWTKAHRCLGGAVLGAEPAGRAGGGAAFARPASPARSFACPQILSSWHLRKYEACDPWKLKIPGPWLSSATDLFPFQQICQLSAVKIKKNSLTPTDTFLIRTYAEVVPT